MSSEEITQEVGFMSNRAMNYRKMGVGWTLQDAKKFLNLVYHSGNTNGPFVVASFTSDSVEELIATGLDLQFARYTSPVDKDPEYFI